MERTAKPRREWDWADIAATKLIRGYHIRAQRGLELRDRIAAALRRAASDGRAFDVEDQEVGLDATVPARVQ